MQEGGPAGEIPKVPMKGGRVICVLWTLEEELGVVVVGPGARKVEVVQKGGGTEAGV
jgi:hypothetical protein